MTAERIDRTLARLRQEKRRALVAYLCIGDPSVEESVELAVACAEAGADMLELGTPFSDPSADGPAIARASSRALTRGGGLGATLAAAKQIRARTDVPLVLFGYANPIFVRGEERTIDDAADAGIDALLVVDLPLEEGAALRRRAGERKLAVVPLLAPTSSEGRAAQLQAAGKIAPVGFVYYVSVAGVTGAAKAPLAEASERAGALRQATSLPVIIGFGIATPDDARSAGAHADGVVVGTALVKIVEEGATAEARRAGVTALIGALRAGLDG
jgi:tryptophan synthase alpha chain